ncbi:hypothetical protein AGMMS50229_01040 [Campylobacterota bacterium]|nr:hypothetical protein AGMMS50229_01040 [Campylobacterota bacterium]
MRTSLREGGRALIWLYGREGNGLYLFFVKPLRLLTKRLPHKALHILCKILAKVLDLYVWACPFLPLPMRRYMLNVIAKWTPHTRFVTIYDQLNPAYAKYYKKDEAIALMQNAGFTNLRIFHRHGYSWSVIGQTIGGGVD